MPLEDAYLSENDGDRDEHVSTIDDLLRPGRYVSYAVTYAARGAPPKFVEARILDVNEREVLFFVIDDDYEKPIAVLHQRGALYAVVPSTGPEESEGGDA